MENTYLLERVRGKPQVWDQRFIRYHNRDFKPKMRDQIGRDKYWSLVEEPEYTCIGHEGTEEERDIALLSFDLGARWRWSGQRHVPADIHTWDEAQYPLQARLCGPRDSLDVSVVNVRRSSNISCIPAAQSTHGRWPLCKKQTKTKAKLWKLIKGHPHFTRCNIFL